MSFSSLQHLVYSPATDKATQPGGTAYFIHTMLYDKGVKSRKVDLDFY